MELELESDTPNMSPDTESVVYTPSTSSTQSIDNPRDDFPPLFGLWPEAEAYDVPPCPCCTPEYWLEEYLEYQGSINFPFGHLMPQEYSDFRASSRDKHRERKARPKNGCNSYKCRKSGQAQARTRNKKSKAENVRFAVRESQKEVPCHTRGIFRRTKHHFVEWCFPREEELDPWVHDMPDAMIRYITTHHGADAFESAEPYVEFGENFSVWCQRRIAEMRAVKENRIRRGDPESFKPMLWERRRVWQHYKGYDIYCGDESTTTQPTNANDALGHALLRSILSPVNWYQKPMRLKNASLFRPDTDYQWFGEFHWAWHRNGSGCWEVGYDGSCDEGPDMCYGCFCRQDTYMPALDEMQSCSLLEWVTDDGKEIIMLEVAREVKLQDSNGGVELSESEAGHGWDVVSVASAESWSIVDVYTS